MEKVVILIVVMIFLLSIYMIINVLVSKNIIWIICFNICDIVEGFIELYFWKKFCSKFIIGIISKVKLIVWIIWILFVKL